MLLALATPKLWDRFSLARASPLPLWRECRPAVGAAPQLPFPPRSRGVPSHSHRAGKVAPPALLTQGGALSVHSLPRPRVHVQA